MSLEIYHMHFAQSDRIVWLCEELSLLLPSFKYTLHVFPRSFTISEYKKKLLELHPLGTVPIMVDSTVSPPVIITESQAILMYIISVHGQGLLAPKALGTEGGATPQEWAQYLFWLSFANGSVQAFMAQDLYAAAALPAMKDREEFENGPMHQFMAQRTPSHLRLYDARLAESKYLAGDDFSAADIMQIYSVTLFRVISGLDLTPYKNLLRWLKDITGRKGYRRMMDRAEDGLPSLFAPTLPAVDIMVMLSQTPWTTNEELVRMKEEHIRGGLYEGEAEAVNGKANGA